MTFRAAIFLQLAIYAFVAAIISTAIVDTPNDDTCCLCERAIDQPRTYDLTDEEIAALFCPIERLQTHGYCH
jgi:hypothetical protein